MESAAQLFGRDSRVAAGFIQTRTHTDTEIMDNIAGRRWEIAVIAWFASLIGATAVV